MRSWRSLGCLRASLCLTVLVLTPLPSLAQSNGSIAGLVTDSTGGVLPGVTVEATSPALIEGVRTGVTNSNGRYAIVELRPGSYAVTFTLAGFSTLVREGIELTSGFAAPVNAELAVGTVEETITVTGVSPVVDVQNVRTQRVLSQDTMNTLPTGKTYEAYASLIPGIVMRTTNQDVGGNRGENPTSLGIHGSRDGDMQVQLDGMRFNSMEGTGGGGARGFFVNYASTQETNLELGNMSAESEVSGLRVNIIPKEGGNSYSGLFVTSYTNGDLQNDNFSQELQDRGLPFVNSVDKIYDVNGSFGGPILEDKLWFYTAHRWWGAENFAAGAFHNKDPLGFVFIPDLDRPATFSRVNRSNNLRLTWQASEKNKLNLFYDNQRFCQCNLAVGTTITPEAAYRRPYFPDYTIQTTWTSALTNKLLLEAGATAVYFDWHLELQPETSPDTISVFDVAAGKLFRAPNRRSPENANLQMNQKFSLSYVTGSHSFKTGVTLMEGTLDKSNIRAGDVNYVLFNSSPIGLTQFTTPDSQSSRLRMDLGLYAQDQWTIKNLTLNLGVRFDYLNAHIPAQNFQAGQFIGARSFAAIDNVPNWKDISPRLGVAYDLSGDGRTALKASLGRYVAGETLNIAANINPSNTISPSSFRSWVDADGDYVPDADLTNPEANGEVGPLANASFGQPIVTRRWDPDVLEGWGKRGYDWEFSAALQHELTPGVGMNVSYHRRWYGLFYGGRTFVRLPDMAIDNLAVTPNDFDPYCFTEPVDARLPSGGGNQVCELFDVTPEKFGLVDELVTYKGNFGDPSQTYNGVDVTFNARLANGAFLGGGVSTGKTVLDQCFVVDSPQEMRFCKTTTPFLTQVKLHGNYVLPWDVQVSGTFQNIPGAEISATHTVTSAEAAETLGRPLAGGVRTVRHQLIPPFTEYENRISQMDVRLGKIFRMEQFRIHAMFDIYNLFNANSILSMNTTYGPVWLQPIQILDGRLFKFGVQIEF